MSAPRISLFIICRQLLVPVSEKDGISNTIHYSLKSQGKKCTICAIWFMNAECRYSADSPQSRG